MAPVLRTSFGWIYLISGLTLTVAAIVLPAHHDLDILKQKKAAIVEDTADLQHQIIVHQTFLEDLKRQDPVLRERVIQMQFNQQPTGATVVIDRAASKTPLDWIAQRARQERVVYLEEPKNSFLAMMTNGKNRLWLAGAGVFIIFVGLINTNSEEVLHPK